MFLLTKCAESRPRGNFFGITSVTDGTAFSVGHLFAATVYNGGPAPNIFSSWIYNYIIGGMNLPQELSGSIFEDLYKKVGACCRFVLVLGQKM